MDTPISNVFQDPFAKQWNLGLPANFVSAAVTHAS